MEFKDIAKITKTFKLEVGNVHAQGAPAVLLAAAGLVLAIGVSRTIVATAPSLPEAFREARGLLTALRGEGAVSLKRP